MTPEAETEVARSLDLALKCLKYGVETQVTQSPAFNGWDRKTRTIQELALLQLSYEALGQRIRCYIVDTYRQLNPIHRLPNELLVKIFSLVSLEGFCEPQQSYLVSLGLVSKQWNRIVYETPSLWSHVSSRYRNQENEAAVIRSQTCPLSVEFSDDDFKEVIGKKRAAFLDFTSHEAYRWRSIDFKVKYHNTLALLRNFTSLSVPQLETLSIGYMGPKRGLLVEDRINMFSGRAGRLRHVKLCDLVIPLSSQLLSRLETLTITGARVSPGPSTNEIIDVLRRCPELRSFELDYSSEVGIRASGATVSEVEAVHLPLLISFDVRLTNAAAFNRIISSVRVPACTRFILTCNDPTSSIFSHESTHFMAALFSTIQCLPRIWLMLEVDGLSMGGSDNRSDTMISILLARSSPWEDLDLLIEATTESGPWPPINANMYCENPAPFLQVVDILCRMPSITELKLTGNSNEYIAQLSHPTFHNGEYGWILPNLKTLSLCDCPENGPRLLKNLPGMRQFEADLDLDQGIEPPTKLEEVHVVMERDGAPGIGPLYTALRKEMGNTWDGHILG
ncbi:hypothetical protein FRB94_009500 [Tulasnella sp. JGI-2019a]|nr:hypothetical protein FRB94_009500 [Tulasnella sp. JGI-2019a]